MEQTKKHGVLFKEPKSKKGRRVLSLPARVVSILKAHRAVQEGHKAILGAGCEDKGLVCCS